MWYKKAQAQMEDGLKSFMPVPELPKEKDDNETIGEIPDEQPLEKPQQQQKLPPLHDWCHCEIISRPDGTKHWHHNPDACSECVDLAREFNQAQTPQNLPVVPVIPEQPVV
jgi:hypothetical protein